MMEVVERTAADLGLLSTNLKLVIPPTVKECRRRREPLSTRAHQDVIKNSLILLQATIGREKPTASELELCSQKIVALIPELRDPLRPIRQYAFKQWVCCAFQ